MHSLPPHADTATTRGVTTSRTGRFARVARHDSPTAGHDGERTRTDRDATAGHAPAGVRTDRDATSGSAPAGVREADAPAPFLRVIARGEVAVEHVVGAAAAGDQAAWDELVRRYAGLVRAVARAHRLTAADSADVYQATWMRLVENLPRLHNPAGVGAWLATTARRECLHTLRRGARETPSEALPEPTTSGSELDRRLIAAERDAALWRAFSTLPERDQALLRALSDDAERSYAEIGDALQMPIGSIGPTRARSLGRLRKALEQTGDIDAIAA